MRPDHDQASSRRVFRSGRTAPLCQPPAPTKLLTSLILASTGLPTKIIVDGVGGGDAVRTVGGRVHLRYATADLWLVADCDPVRSRVRTILARLPPSHRLMYFPLRQIPLLQQLELDVEGSARRVGEPAALLTAQWT